jgi:glucose/arabinose dehydrogenase
VMWFTENGRDQLGDEMPNDELNHPPIARMKR